MAGTTFGRYKLVRLLARGGMAEVYLALLSGVAGFEKQIALKKILPIYTDLEEFHQLFQDEARISVSLSHSNIVQVFDFGVHHAEYYLAMEYVDGPDLEKVLMGARKMGRQLSIDSVVHIAMRIASALEYAHSRVDQDGHSLELVHRDVSPPNVLLSVQGEVKLTDFGVARYAQRISQSQPGIVRGKYAYMSPEQLTGGGLDRRSDLFSLGVLLFEMVTNVNPFLGGSDYKTMEKVVACRPGSVADYRSGVPRNLMHIVERCLRVHPGTRYQSAGHIRRDLAELLFSRGVIDDRQLLVDELWALFPSQLSRRGPSVPRPREDSPSAISVGMPRMRAGQGVTSGEEDWVGPGTVDTPQLHPEFEDPDPEEDLTNPDIVENPDGIPTQPLEGLSHTLDVAPLAPASEATLREERENPFTVKGLQSRSSRRVRVEALLVDRAIPGIQAALTAPVEIEEKLSSAPPIGGTDDVVAIPDPLEEVSAGDAPEGAQTKGHAELIAAEAPPRDQTNELPGESKTPSPGGKMIEKRRTTSVGAKKSTVGATRAEVEAAAKAVLRQQSGKSEEEELPLYGYIVFALLLLALLWFGVNAMFGPESSTPSPDGSADPGAAEVFDPATGDSAAIGSASPSSGADAPEVPPAPVKQSPPGSNPKTAPEPAPEPAPTGVISTGVTMTIATSPEGGDLTIDGMRVGPAPFEMKASPGAIVEIVARKDAYLSTTRLVRFEDQASRTTVDLTPMLPRADAPKRKVTITAEPWAYVAVDGVATGKSTPLTLEIEPGRHSITIENPLESWTDARTVVVEPGKDLTVSFKKP